MGASWALPGKAAANLDREKLNQVAASNGRTPASEVAGEKLLCNIGGSATANLDREKLNQVAASNPTEATISESMAWLRAVANPIFVTRIDEYALRAPRRPFQETSRGHKYFIFIA